MLSTSHFPALPILPGAASLSTESGLRTQPSADLASRYLLVCHARSLSITEGVWYFTLETLDGDAVLDAEDHEEGDLNRLSLLAAVRGLEAIDGGSLVSLVSNNRYLIRSLDQSLPRWRENDFVWEHFGRKLPVQNADLWRRIDRTLDIHQVTASLVQTTRVSSRYQGDAAPTDPLSQAPLPLVPQLSARSQGTAAGEKLRFDSAQLPGRRPTDPTLPTDRLRQWLAGADPGADTRPGRRGRYRAEDLALG